MRVQIFNAFVGHKVSFSKTLQSILCWFWKSCNWWDQLPKSWDPKAQNIHDKSKGNSHLVLLFKVLCKNHDTILKLSLLSKIICSLLFCVSWFFELCLEIAYLAYFSSNKLHWTLGSRVRWLWTTQLMWSPTPPCTSLLMRFFHHEWHGIGIHIFSPINKVQFSLMRSVLPYHMQRSITNKYHFISSELG